jgi:hypothetical protein
MKPPFCAKTEKGLTRRGALFTRALRVLHATPVYTLRTKTKNYTLHANPCLHRRLHVTRKFLFTRVSVNPFLALNYYYTVLYYCRTQETPGAPEDTRGNKEGRQRGRRAQRHHEGRRAQRGIGRDTKRTGGTTVGLERAARPQGFNTPAPGCACIWTTRDIHSSMY